MATIQDKVQPKYTIQPSELHEAIIKTIRSWKWKKNQFLVFYMALSIKWKLISLIYAKIAPDFLSQFNNFSFNGLSPNILLILSKNK